MARTVETMSKAGQTVLDRLKAAAQLNGRDTQAMMRIFALERFLARAARCPDADGWCLKGGMLMLALGVDYHRPTEDIDFTTSTPFDEKQLVRTIKSIAAMPPDEEDGFVYRIVDDRKKAVTVHREGEANPGLRVLLEATLHRRGGATSIPVKIDAAWGEAITPDPRIARLPQTCRGYEPPELPVYPWETVVAEKLHAVQKHGRANTRLKDFYDLVSICRGAELDSAHLVSAIRNTWARRADPAAIDEMPDGLTDAFAVAREGDWRRFISTRGMSKSIQTLRDAVTEIRPLAVPALRAAAQGTSLVHQSWIPPRGWSERSAVSARLLATRMAREESAADLPDDVTEPRPSI